MLGGFAIDADHVLDQWWSIRAGGRVPDEPGARGAQSLYARYLKRRKLVRLPLAFHSFELLAVIAVLTLNHPTPFLIGLSAGYALHLALDMIRHQHEFRSALFYLLAYRLAHGFRRDQLIKPEHL